MLGSKMCKIENIVVVNEQYNSVNVALKVNRSNMEFTIKVKLRPFKSGH